MPLDLRIENQSKLPDGGPVSIAIAEKRGIDIGRDSHLDWTLPDPTRHISSKHCEIRYNEGGYWLHDVSTNGTFLNGSDHRMQAPHRLRTGDRFAIGHYIIGARVEGEEAAASAGAAAAPAGAPNYQELWAADANVAPPIDRALLKPKKELQAANRDFLDWAADIPDTSPAPSSFGEPGRAPPPLDPNMDWASGPPTPQPPPPEPPPAAPTPRRPVWVAAEPDGPWGGDSVAKAERAPEIPAASPETPRPAPPPAPRSQPGTAPSSNAIAQRLAQGARVPEEFFANRDPAELTELFGQVMRLVVENTMQLLNARVQAKRLARSSSHTMIEAFNNNPLKFSPSAEDAIRIMFGPTTRSYLDAYRAFAQSFDDLKSHQIKTYSAMQHALITLMEDLDPQTIEREAEDRGIASLVTSRKAKLWDAYVARWQAKTRRESGGMIDSFMLNFAEYYDREGE
jgi:type VI secretion system protein ImpI